MYSGFDNRAKENKLLPISELIPEDDRKERPWFWVREKVRVR
jgi:hypothetical protein